MTGEVFGKLVVLEEYMAPLSDGSIRKHADVRCVCGRRRHVLMGNLRSGKTKGCGSCDRPVKHGANRRGKTEPLYKLWQNMKRRCDSPNIPTYKYYGARGIRVCDRWLSFENFKNDMSPRPDGMTLDRIDSLGDYCPENCRWISIQDQQRNRRSNRKIEYAGKQYGTVAEFIEELGLKNSVVRSRLARGWSPEDIVNTPPMEYANG